MLSGELFGVRTIRQNPLNRAGRGLGMSTGGGPGQEIGHAGCQRPDAVSRCTGRGLAHRVRKILFAEVEVIEQSGKSSHSTSVTHWIRMCMHT